MVPEYTLQPPALAWPRDASLLGYEFFGLLISTLCQGCFVSYVGWYVDSPDEGSVWHRWKHTVEAQLGVSLIVSIYALWIGGWIDIVLRSPEKGDDEVLLVPRSHAGDDLPALEQDILALVRSHGRLRAREVVERLPLPSRKRGLDAWFFSGAPSGRASGKQGWFKQVSSFSSEAPLRMQQALDLAGALVALELADDPPGAIYRSAESFRQQAAAFVIESQIFDAIRALP